MGAEELKQDCETKAFRRLAGKIRGAFPRLPIILLADSLYASEPVMDICRDNGGEYIIRYKAGSIPSITEEYEGIPEKGAAGHAEFVNKKREMGILHPCNVDNYPGRQESILRNAKKNIYSIMGEVEIDSPFRAGSG